jgi:hypothetical protein
MIAVLQLSIISLISIYELNPTFSSLKQLQLVNGYNKISNHSPYVDPNSSYEIKGI